MSEFLTLQDILEVHRLQIEMFGGSHGVRDMGLLDAAVARAQSGYYEDVVQEAAALWESLSQNHPFVDGNKRTAAECAEMFLQVNGLAATARTADIIAWIDECYQTGTMNFAHIEAWLRIHTAPV